MRAREFENQPAVYSTERQFTAFRACSNDGVLIKQPAQLGRRKISINDEPGFFTNQFRFALLAQQIAGAGSSTILPNDGVADWFTGLAIPEQGGFTLIGDPDGGDIAGC